MITDSLDRELNLMKVPMQLKEDQIQQLRKAGKEPIATLAKELSLRVWDNRQQGVFDTNKLPPTVYEVILDKATDVVGAKKVEAFKTDQSRRAIFKRGAGINGFLAAIDQALCLSVEQTERFRETLELNWQEDWAHIGMMADQSGLLILRSKIEKLPTDELEQFLRPSQISALGGPDPAKFRTLMASADKENREEQMKSYEAGQRLHCESVASLKIEALQTLFSLDTQKIETLNTGAKKAVERVVAQQKLAFVKFAEHGPSNLDSKSADFLSIHVFDQIDNRPEWQRSIDDVLDRDQKKVRATREAARKQLRFESRFSSMVAGFSERFAFTSNQERVFLDLLLAKAKSNKNDASQAYRTLLSIPDSKFQLILDANQWQRFGSTLKAMRNQMSVNPDS